MISKDKFVSILKFIQEKDIQQQGLINALEIMCPYCYVDAFIYSEYEAKMLELLGELLHDKNDDISYFLYDLDALNEKDLIVPQDKCELYNSPDTLYDYLIKNIDDKYE